jgi:NADP-dependent 3-hydroxy acid dehydrogenase YdfG
MHVLITGAARGIGAAIAEKLAREIGDQLRLSLCARDLDALKSVHSRIEQDSTAQVLSGTCDVRSEQSINDFVTSAQNAFGSIDVLVNNAGLGRFAPVHEMPLETFDLVVDTNLRGVFLMTQAVLPRMKLRRSGTIVTISSLAGRNGLENGAAYCASKFGVRGLMQSLFLEVREFNIRVITLFPGSVDTEFFDTLGGLTMKQPLKASDIADAAYAAICMPSHATISELDIRPTNPKG